MADTPSLVALMVGILSASGTGAVINWIRDRRKDATSVEQTSVDVMRTVMAELRTELTDVRRRLAEAETEIAELRARLAAYTHPEETPDET